MPEQRFKEKKKVPKPNRLASHRTATAQPDEFLHTVWLVRTLHCLLRQWTGCCSKGYTFPGTLQLYFDLKEKHTSRATEPCRVFAGCSTAPATVLSCRKPTPTHHRTVPWERGREASRISALVLHRRCCHPSAWAEGCSCHATTPTSPTSNMVDTLLLPRKLWIHKRTRALDVLEFHFGHRAVTLL